MATNTVTVPTASDGPVVNFGIEPPSMKWVVTPDGRWIYAPVDEASLDPGNVISPTPPPIGTAYWVQGPTGQWTLPTYTGNGVEAGATYPQTPSTTPFKDANPNLYPPPAPAAEDIPRLRTLVDALDPVARRMWREDPRNAAQVAALVASGYSFGDSTVPPVSPPRRPGAPTGAATVPGAVWNNPESEAPRGYNPELWAQREIGPNRTYSGGVTGLGVGGPTDSTGAAIYQPPAAMPRQSQFNANDAALMAPDPNPSRLFQRQDYEGRFGDSGSDILSNAAGNTFERNLLNSIAEKINDPIEGPRARFVMSALSNPEIISNAVVPGPRRMQPANLIDRAGAVYDTQNSGSRRRSSSTEEETGKGTRKMDNPFMPRMAGGSVDIARARNDLNRMVANAAAYPSKYSSVDIARANNALQQSVNNAAANPSMNPFRASFMNPSANPNQRRPVNTKPAQSFPTPTQRNYGLSPAPNPFLMGGAGRGNLNPFR